MVHLKCFKLYEKKSDYKFSWMKLLFIKLLEEHRGEYVYNIRIGKDISNETQMPSNKTGKDWINIHTKTLVTKREWKSNLWGRRYLQLKI